MAIVLVRMAKRKRPITWTALIDDHRVRFSSFQSVKDRVFASGGTNWEREKERARESAASCIPSRVFNPVLQFTSVHYAMVTKSYPYLAVIARLDRARISIPKRQNDIVSLDWQRQIAALLFATNKAIGHRKPYESSSCIPIEKKKKANFVSRNERKWHSMIHKASAIKNGENRYLIHSIIH